MTPCGVTLWTTPWTSEDARLPGLQVNLRGDILVRRRAHIPPVSGDDGRADGFHHHLSREIPLGANLIEGQQQFAFHTRKFLPNARPYM
jgi:hypothetical protein